MAITARMSGRRSESVSRFQSVEPSETNSETAVRLRSSSRSAALSYRHPNFSNGTGVRALDEVPGATRGVGLGRAPGTEGLDSDGYRVARARALHPDQSLFDAAPT